jgi:ubiquitin-conjugating enzyme E2 J2
MSARAVKRLGIELQKLQQQRPDLADARPDQDNLLVWYYVLDGAPGSPYEGGEYFGKLVFPEEYPLKPPRIEMITPSGRFLVNTRLCTTMSDYHPESWSPIWSITNLLVGLNSFMNDKQDNFIGALKESDKERRRLAQASHAFNLSLPLYTQLFPGRVAMATAKAAAAPATSDIAEPPRRKHRTEKKS